jgi:mRNA interferase MazF
MQFPDLFRGEVWDVELIEPGDHPAVVMSISPMNARLGHCAVIFITGTTGPAHTHVPLDSTAGLTKHPESYANITDIHAVDRALLVERRGMLAPSDLRHIEELLGLYLGIGSA